jgi:hypothetical protein
MTAVLRAYFTNYHFQLMNKAVLRAWGHLHLLYDMMKMISALKVIAMTAPILIDQNHHPSTQTVVWKPNRKISNATCPSKIMQASTPGIGAMSPLNNVTSPMMISTCL